MVYVANVRIFLFLIKNVKNFININKNDMKMVYKFIHSCIKTVVQSEKFTKNLNINLN